MWIWEMDFLCTEAVSRAVEHYGETQNFVTSCYSHQTGSARIFPFQKATLINQSHTGKCRHFLFGEQNMKWSHFELYHCVQSLGNISKHLCTKLQAFRCKQFFSISREMLKVDQRATPSLFVNCLWILYLVFSADIWQKIRDLTKRYIMSLSYYLSTSCRNCLTICRPVLPALFRGQIRTKVYKRTVPVREPADSSSKPLVADITVYTQNNNLKALQPCVMALGRSIYNSITSKRVTKATCLFILYDEYIL